MLTKEHIHTLLLLTQLRGSMCTGVGVGPNKIETVVGICKAYSTRVGAGPFPTELTDEIGDQIRETGHEYGTVTGRPRRVGWFDSVAMRHARRVSGISCLSLNLLDVLTGLKTVKICTSYKLDGKQIDYYPASLKELERVVNQFMKNFQDGMKILLVQRSLKTYQLMHKNYLEAGK